MEQNGFVNASKNYGSIAGAVLTTLALFSSIFYGISWVNRLEYRIERGDTTALQITETIKEVRSEVKDIKSDFKLIKDEITSIKISLAAMSAHKGSRND